MKNVENGLDDFMNQNNENIDNILDNIRSMKNTDDLQDLHEPLSDLQKQLEEVMA